MGAATLHELRRLLAEIADLERAQAVGVRVEADARRLILDPPAGLMDL